MYPINLNLTGKSCFIVGGGHVALRKIKGLLHENARVMVISPDIVPGIQTLVQTGRVLWREEAFQPDKGMLDGAFLVFCATDSMAINRLAANEAHRAGALVNSATDTGSCDFQVPSSVHRGNVLLTVSTGGGSPAFSRLMRKDLEKHYGEAFGEWLIIMENLRNLLKERCHSDTSKREQFWRQLMDDKGEYLLELIREGNLEQAEVEVRNAFDALDCPGA